MKKVSMLSYWAATYQGLHERAKTQKEEEENEAATSSSQVNAWIASEAVVLYTLFVAIPRTLWEQPAHQF